MPDDTASLRWAKLNPKAEQGRSQPTFLDGSVVGMQRTTVSISDSSLASVNFTELRPNSQTSGLMTTICELRRLCKSSLNVGCAWKTLCFGFRLYITWSNRAFRENSK
ncbi:Protein FAM63A [Trichinella nativa]|uniref:Protein FAM63A n=1 Tax=Trichinella nativa TaxID=6335 RepID=A0A0V1L7M0_9BILA|nr:Protein FAM63A [Trichinella nativa]